MAKIAYNGCYGGFSLSHEAHLRYAELKGLKIYPEKGDFSLWTYWLVPKGERGDILTSERFMAEKDMEIRKASNEAYRQKTMPSLRDVVRHDPILIQVVEELGDKANGQCAKIKLEEVAAGTLYRIDEYDGKETVATQSTYEWSVAS